MTKLPEGPDDWQFHSQNYARLLLIGHKREQIDTILANVKRIQGDNQEQILRDFLNHEKKAIADGIPPVKPESVIKQEAEYQKTRLSKDEQYEQHKRDLAASSEFTEKLAK
ncbi:hypothetical protein [uncultured Paraglaciecola sp.]|uniref:hypothetical protein n=1 Tax=uncultured Paraglaciecola sp. TaxID=1765024 RepID=UPI0026345291|nr:hypothetical protein [uncultured Paraglaciecola sp.]